MTKEILETWLDYRIKVYEIEHKHKSLVWGKLTGIMEEREFGISACGLPHDKEIQLYISQFHTNTADDILKEVADIIGVQVEDARMEGYKQFKYKDYTFFADITYSEEEKATRIKYGLEV